MFSSLEIIFGKYSVLIEGINDLNLLSGYLGSDRWDHLLRGQPSGSVKAFAAKVDNTSLTFTTHTEEGENGLSQTVRLFSDFHVSQDIWATVFFQNQQANKQSNKQKCEK